MPLFESTSNLLGVVVQSRARVWIHCAKRKHPEMFPDKSVRLAKKLDDEKLYRLYIEEDKNTNEIAEIYNVSSKTIRNWLHKCGIELKERCKKKKNRVIMRNINERN